MITVLSRIDVENGLANGRNLISLHGRGGPIPNITDNHPAKLTKIFDDVPSKRFFNGKEYMFGPSYDDVKDIMNFAKDKDDIVIHCEQGRSRSTASATAILFQKELKFDDAVYKLKALRDSRPDFHPNPLIIKYAEDILGFGNKEIHEVLLQLCPRYVTWVKYWERQGVSNYLV